MIQQSYYGSKSSSLAIQKRRISAFYGALLLFASLNFLLSYRDSSLPFSKLALDSVHFDYRGTESGADKLPAAANVLLVGSSLLLYPMWRVDQADGAYLVDSNHYHLARSLDREFAKQQVQTRTYNLAVGGCMMSDSYLLLKHYLRSHPAPQYVIVDSAPRSFYDGGVIAPDATPIFHSCFNASDYMELSRLYLPALVSKLNYFACRLCYMYHHRRWLADTIVQALSKPGTMFDTRAIAALSPPIAQSSQQVIVAKVPTKIIDTPDKFAYTLQDYTARYFLINSSRMQTQINFLQLIAALCNAHGIKLVVVNMPLTQANLSLLPAGFYNEFKSTVSSVVAGKAVFVDLNEKANWPISYYSDSVHLNDRGGAAFNKQLAQIIASLSERSHL
jgi:hypothetical protein